MSDQLDLFGGVEPAKSKQPRTSAKPDLIKATQKLCNGKDCDAVVLWTLRKGKPHPYNADGTSHFTTCPNANFFRGKS